MGFNYLQTDDRDDYFASMGGGNSRVRSIGIKLVDKSGVTIFDCVKPFRIRAYCKKNYLPIGVSGKGKWRKILESKGYKVLNVK